MFGKIATVVLALLRSAFGLSRGTTSLTIGSPVTQLLGADGTISAPFYSWTNSTGSGWYNAGSNIFRYTVNGTTELDVRPGQVFAGSSTSALFCVGTSSDAGFRRAAAGVVKMDTSSSAGGWLQITSGEARRTATQTVTDTTTFAADNTLSCTLIAGRRYRFYIWYAFTTVNSSGVKLDLNGGGATMTAINGTITILSSAMAVLAAAQITALTSTTGVTASGTLAFASIEGSLECLGAGTFIPRFAQNTETGAAESVIAQIGSYITLADVP